MYAINEHINGITINASAVSANVRSVPWLKFPRPVTIKAAFAVSESGILTANTTNYLAMALLNGGTIGTATLTIATFGSVATPYTWTARQGYQATFDTTTNQDLTANQWLVAQVSETASQAIGVLSLCVQYVEGTGRTA